MVIAKQKKNENIAEYILYIWQIEDLLRAYKFDIDELEKDYLRKSFDYSQADYQEIKKWYEALINMMKEEKITGSGHLIFIKNTVNDLNRLHLNLLQSPEHFDYHNQYRKTKVFIDELAQKSPKAQNEIDLCFIALYGVLVLKMQKKEISRETQEAIAQISELISLLATKYHSIEKGEIDLSY